MQQAHGKSSGSIDVKITNDELKHFQKIQELYKGLNERESLPKISIMVRGNEIKEIFKEALSIFFLLLTIVTF